MWEYLAQFDRITYSEWALATTCGALRPLSGSASPRLQVNLSIPDRVVVGHVNDPDRNFPLDVIVICEPPSEGVQFGVEVKDKPVTGAELLRSINKAQAGGVQNIVFLAASSSQRDLDYSSEAEFARDMGCRLVCFFDWDAFSRMVFALSPAMGPQIFSDVFKFIGKKLVEIGATQHAVDQWHEYSELPP